MQQLVSLLPLIGIALLFWLLIIRPASRRQKQMGQMQSALNVGDRVMLTSGFYGTVQALRDDRIEVALAPGVVVEVIRGAVGSVIPADAGVVEDPSSPEHGTEHGTGHGPEHGIDLDKPEER